MKRFAWALWSTFACILILAGPLQAAPRYYFQDLGVLPGGNQSYAYGVNQAGQVAGEATAAGYWRAFLKDPGPGQPLQDLGNLGGASRAWAINNAGQIVGWADDTTSHPKAFLWEKGVMYNLNHLTVNLPGDGEWPGVFLGSATAINNRGCIVGSTGTYPPHAYLLTPVTMNPSVELLLLD